MSIAYCELFIWFVVLLFSFYFQSTNYAFICVETYEKFYGNESKEKKKIPNKHMANCKATKRTKLKEKNKYYLPHKTT